MLAYVIKLTPDDNDTFLITCPVLPEVTTFGKNDDEIHSAAIAAIEEAIAARIGYGEELPAPVEAAGRPPCPVREAAECTMTAVAVPGGSSFQQRVFPGQPQDVPALANDVPARPDETPCPPGAGNLLQAIEAPLQSCDGIA